MRLHGARPEPPPFPMYERAATSVVTACYRELAGEPPAPAVLDAEVAELRRDAAAVTAMLRRLNATPAAARVRVDSVLAQIARNAREQRPGAVRPLIGLGTMCYTAALLKSAGLKRGFYPFDALFSSPRMVAHCLADDFATLMSPRFFQPIPVEQRSSPNVNLCDHAWYREHMHIPIVFNHFDPTDPRDFAPLARSIDAFRDITRREPVTFVLVTSDAMYWQDIFQECSSALRAYAPLARLVYVVVREEAGHAVPQPRLCSDTDGHALIEFVTSSAWLPLSFENPLDDVVMLSLILERM